MAVSQQRPGHHPLQPRSSRSPRSPRDCPKEYITMNGEPRRPSSPDRLSRSSFSSIRENESTLTQTFTQSKVSSYLTNEEAIDDPLPSPSRTSPTSSSPLKMIQTQFQPPVTQPHSKLLGYWSPADSFKGWKEVQVKGKLASKSFGDLQMLNRCWTSPPKKVAKRGGRYQAGDAPIEKLPIEILTSITNLLVLDIPPNGITRRNVDLMSLLLTSKTLHVATLSSLYNRITIPHSRIFHKFLTHVAAHPTLGTIVRRLDFCHFNPSLAFSTAAERSQARNLTSETLLRCLELTPYLQEFLAQEYIDEDLDAGVLQKLFLGLPRLQALDFTGCTSKSFKAAFTAIVTPDWPMELSIRRLSLHKCLTLPSSILETILPRLKKLTHLDVAGTRITDAALASIPGTARITHLNLAKCTLLSARAVIDFLATHPAVQELVFLSLGTDARSHQLFDVDDLTELLPKLPQSLKSLSIKGSRMDAGHIDLLRPLTKHLEELALGRSLNLEDVNRLFVPDENDDGEISMQIDWVPHTLRYIDLSDMWGSELDLPYLFNNQCAILRSFSEPLEVVEIAEDVCRRVAKSKTALQRIGWRLSECGSRGWMVRENKNETGGPRDDGRRSWKMGAEAWGMRKIPVARAEVGGMYGSFMFGRKL
ncbi:putative F-box protein [Diplogelasinospora grovesii]|uniref:F-box protein n=1 Tax=Diplogelasinospora grovesii TaxID=303347 RepID=A0AAN6NEZ2_9PEZI|nr:putative F-box protein [Diplogelasinospora grovesii]